MYKITSAWIMIAFGLFLSFKCSAKSVALSFCAGCPKSASVLLPNNIYLLNTANGRTVQITRGDGVDSDPLWSPHKKCISFVRTISEMRSEICIFNLQRKTVRDIYDYRSTKYFDFNNCTWSPRGDAIAFIASMPPDNTWRTGLAFVMINLDGSVHRLATGVDEYAWSPDGSHVLLRFRGYKTAVCRVLNVMTGEYRQFRTPIRDPQWLDNSHLIGDIGDDVPTFVVANSKGAVVRRIRVNMAVTEDLSNYVPWFDYLRWYLVARDRSQIVFVAEHKMDDGWHSSSYVLNIRSRTIQPLGSVDFRGFTRSGREYICLVHKWSGAYPGQGVPLGKLNICIFPSQRKRALTDWLANLNDAD